MTKIILNGCLGRMGRVVRELLKDDPFCEIVAGIDTATIGEGLTFPTYSELSVCEMPADVVIDFSGISAIHGLLAYGTTQKIPLVICSTGLSPELLKDVQDASKEVGIFQSANMSLGINLMAHMLEKASRLLYEARFDIEIIEKHHNQKLDAPSGTALMLAQSINEALDGELNLTYHRAGQMAKRDRNELGIHALRGGTIVGEHSVIFAGQDEVIEFKHNAHSREVFAVGAVKAAAFMKGKPPGLYNMQDLINAI